MNLDKNKVLVAMSGGVDSSVTAALLLEQGYDVIAITISTHKLDDDCIPTDNQKGCCTYQNMADAYQVCQQLGIEHKMIDLTKQFEKTIISNFIDEYMNGRTPNPCVLCNNLVKWGMFMDKANELGAQFIATGHYAQVYFNKELNRYVLTKGVDVKKDQSYVLWGLSQEQLSRTILPIGNLVKKTTREIAKKHNLPVFNKEESQEICFVPGDDYRKFLRKAVPDFDNKIKQGIIIRNGKVVGKHDGFVNYTIGQRKGLGLVNKNPLYVKEINAGLNVIEVSESDGLFSNGLLAKDINFVKYPTIEGKREFGVRIRYHDAGEKAICSLTDEGLLLVEFMEPRRAVTPGQSVVLYEGDDVVGGGIIQEKW